MQRGSIAAATSVSVPLLSDKPPTAAIITIDTTVAVSETADQLKPHSYLLEWNYPKQCVAFND